MISAAKPKIANYPFTTLTPNLGVVALSGDRSFVVADVPGLIEGAHEGHGLGHQFLRHIERTKVLIHLVDVSGESGRDPVEDFDTIRRELELYNPEMLAKPQLVAANKIDAVDDPKRVDRAREAREETEAEVLPDLRGDRRRRQGADRSGVADHREGRARSTPKAIELAQTRTTKREAPADYNPALVPLLSRGPRKGGQDVQKSSR